MVYERLEDLDIGLMRLPAGGGPSKSVTLRATTPRDAGPRILTGRRRREMMLGGGSGTMMRLRRSVHTDAGLVR